MKFKDAFKIAGSFYIMWGLFWISIGIMAGYWTLYYLSVGLSFAQIATLILMWPIAAILFEVPTGAIADIFGRKVSVTMGYFFVGLSFLGLIASGSNFTLMLLFMFLSGISFTLTSGAVDAWFYDYIKHIGKENKFHELYSKGLSIGLVGFAIGPFIGGLIVKYYSYRTTFIACAICLIFSAIFIILAGKEDYFKRKKIHISKDIKNSIKTAKKGLKYVTKHPVILVLTLIQGVFSFSIGALFFNAYPIHVVNVGLKPEYIGYALSAAGVISIFTLYNSDKIIKVIGGNKKSLFLATLLCGLIAIGIGLVTVAILIFASLVMMTIINKFAITSAPAYQELYNKFVPSKIRATVGSVRALSDHIGDLLGIAAFGIISEFYGVKFSVISGGVIGALAAFLYFFIKKE